MYRVIFQFVCALKGPFTKSVISLSVRELLQGRSDINTNCGPLHRVSALFEHAGVGLFIPFDIFRQYVQGKRR